MNKKNIMNKSDTEPQSDITTDDKGNITINAPMVFMFARPPANTHKD